MEFYIDKNRIELGTTKITQVFQINDIGEPKDRQLNYSYPFEIPITPNNLKALGMLGVSSIVTTPYRLLKGKLVENGVEIISDGVVTIKGKVTKKGKEYFKAYLYGGNIYLFDAIGSKKINELDFSDLNHQVTRENYINSFKNKEGYIYAVSDFGKFSGEEIEINYQVPSVFVHTLWNKIFKESNVEYFGEIFQSEKFKNLLISMKRGYNSEKDTLNDDGIKAIGKTTYLSKNQQYPVNGGHSISDINTLYVFDKKVTGNRNFITINKTKKYHLKATIKVVVKSDKYISSDIRVRSVSGGGVGKVIFQEKENSRNSYVIQGVFDLKKGDKLYFNHLFIYKKIVSTPEFTDIREMEIQLSSDDDLLNFRFNSFIGEMRQIDFVKDVMQHFGLIFQKKRNKLAYDFIQIKKLIKDRGATIDWSKKLVNQNEEKYKLDKYAQSNIFAYNYLEKDSQRFADGILNIDNQTLPIQKKLVTRPYNAPTISENSLLKHSLTYTPFWKPERDKEGNITKYKPFQSKNYLVELSHVKGTIKYGLINATKENFTGDVPVYNFRNLSYRQLLEENYSELKNTLDFNSVVSVNLLLNEWDIRILDLFKTVYLEQFTSDFYINKIRYTNSTVLSQVELVKIKRTPSKKTIVTNPKITIKSSASKPGTVFF